MDRESSLQNWNAFTRPKDKTILSFSGFPYTVALARLLLESTPGEQCSETLLQFLPHPTDIDNCIQYLYIAAEGHRYINMTFIIMGLCEDCFKFT